jgi:shikimate dehydrogenase
MSYITGLLGHPVNHSLSPQIHNKWYKEEKLPIKYELFDCPPEKLTSFFSSWPEKLLGLSVTIPHKEKVAQFLDSISSEAKIIGAINTIVKDPQTKKLRGENTDWQGFLNSISLYLPGALTETKFLIFGTGGSSRAIIYALSQITKPKNIYLTGRSLDKIQALCQEFNINHYHQDKIYFTAIINCTPLGLKATDESPISPDLITEKTIIYDLTYGSVNKLQKITKAKNGTYIDGYDMLEKQAHLQHLLFIEGISN